MKQGQCHTCERTSSNLLTVNCGHHICFQCVKNNRNSQKCSQCVAIKSRGSLSPSHRSSQQERNNRITSIQNKKSHEQSPSILKTSRKSVHLINSNRLTTQIDHEIDSSMQLQLVCKQHHQPLTLFCKISKEVLCTVCLCSRSKYSNQILPIRGAQDFLRKQNHLQRQQARIALNDIDNAKKIIKKNIQQFEYFFQQNLKSLKEIFEELHHKIELVYQQNKKIIAQFYSHKIDDYRQTDNDLEYLSNTLKEYRQANRDNNTLNQLVYVYSSYKVIKKTLRSLNFDYISYAGKQLDLMEYSDHKFNQVIQDIVVLKTNLPLKNNEINKIRSLSIKSINRNNLKEKQIINKHKYSHEEEKFNRDKKNKSRHNRHQMSLCSQANVIEINQQEKNLYKKLLKSRFKY